MRIGFKEILIVLSIVLFNVWPSVAIEVKVTTDSISEDIENLKTFLQKNPFPDSAYSVEIKSAELKTGNNTPFLKVGFSLKRNDDFFNSFNKLVHSKIKQDFLKLIDVDVKQCDSWNCVFSMDINFELKDASGKAIEKYIRKEWIFFGRNDDNYDLMTAPGSGDQKSYFYDTIYTHIPLKGDDTKENPDAKRIKDITASVATCQNKIEKNNEQDEADRKKREKREEEVRLAKERKAAEEATRNTPAYKRSVIAEELCQQHEALSQANQALKHQNEVDLATGTTNLYERRQLGTAKLYIEQEIARLKKEYKKLGGGEFSRKKQCE